MGMQRGFSQNFGPERLRVAPEAPTRPVVISLDQWARWPWQRCKSVNTEGRCDLRRGHDIDHAAERGMVTWRWRYPEDDPWPAALLVEGGEGR